MSQSTIKVCILSGLWVIQYTLESEILAAANKVLDSTNKRYIETAAAELTLSYIINVAGLCIFLATKIQFGMGFIIYIPLRMCYYSRLQKSCNKRAEQWKATIVFEPRGRAC